MEPLFSDLHPHSISSTIKNRLSNSYLIGEISGMLIFGFIIDKLGRRTGIVFATCFLILGIILATAAHGESQIGMFWMMIVGRGVAGFGAGGEYPDEGYSLQCQLISPFDTGFVVAGVLALIILACYHQRLSEGVWKVAFGLGKALSLTVFSFRIRMINSTQYRKHAIKQHIPYWLALKRH
ncbi:hypothetical protein HO173_008514 [Letharia columbiana]|uniref:Major facilitator superfamily (MFS) profile domain-containing protein n=1 Tax=Letharia columbiana TaxID=112416 RepID=A0A8H6FR75_9LECA|nr:uncharacterized protein HO173_008514 [Letharia columbiana]KAF6233225.1 hypothetical protein HO173_008514 [Letharia columbiana]